MRPPGLTEAQQIALDAAVRDKTGDGRWYERMVPRADRIYDEYLAVLREEGLLDGSQGGT